MSQIAGIADHLIRRALSLSQRLPGHVEKPLAGVGDASPQAVDRIGTGLATADRQKQAQ